MSRFVPAGASLDEAAPAASSDDAWASARQAVISQSAPKKSHSNEEPSKGLYETLEANKAAKQAEFEESIRLKNQFRTLDEDEAEFLDSVVEAERAKEAAVRKDTALQLEIYRQQQETATKIDLDRVPKTPSVEPDTWATKKRRKKELDNPMVKVRKTSTSTDVKREELTTSIPTDLKQKELQTSLLSATNSGHEVSITTMNRESVEMSPGTRSSRSNPEQPTAIPSQALGLDLGGYSSDED